MKKLLILSMLCNKEKWLNEANIVRRTWANDILQKKYNNIDMYFFTSSTNGEDYVDENAHVIYVNSKDGVADTAEKTIKAFKYSLNNFDFDYCILTNTSTVLNIKLINEFINSDLIDEKCFYGGKLICRFNACLFFRGNFIMLGHESVLKVATNSKIVSHLFYGANDVNIFYTLFYTEKIENFFLNKLMCVSCIDDFDDKFSVKEIGSKFYVSAKSEDLIDNDDVVLSNLVGVYSFIKSDNRDYDISKLVFRPNIIDTVCGRYKIEKI